MQVWLMSSVSAPELRPEEWGNSVKEKRKTV